MRLEMWEFTTYYQRDVCPEATRKMQQFFLCPRCLTSTPTSIRSLDMKEIPPARVRLVYLSRVPAHGQNPSRQVAHKGNGI